MEFDELLARELEIVDEPLQSRDPLFHATKNIGGIRTRGALLSLGAQRAHGDASAGFGHRVIGSGENHVSLTDNESRGRAYFDVLVVLAAIAERRMAVADWLAWYFARWIPDRTMFLQTIDHDPGAEFPGVFADALARVNVVPNWRDGDVIWQELVVAVGKLDVTEQLGWLFELDTAAMQKGDNLDKGLGVVGAEAAEWAKLRIADVALLEVRLPPGATGHREEEENELRVAGQLTDFSIVANGEARFGDWPW
jgi:hypothetical protein